jgi:hypothetical protein
MVDDCTRRRACQHRGALDTGETHAQRGLGERRVKESADGNKGASDRAARRTARQSASCAPSGAAPASRSLAGVAARSCARARVASQLRRLRRKGVVIGWGRGRGAHQLAVLACNPHIHFSGRGFRSSGQRTLGPRPSSNSLDRGVQCPRYSYKQSSSRSSIMPGASEQYSIVWAEYYDDVTKGPTLNSINASSRCTTTESSTSPSPRIRWRLAHAE